MRRFAIAIVLSALLLVAITSAQQAPTTSVPNLIRYGGTLKDAQGAPLSSSTLGATFAIYSQQDGGAPIWMETQNVTTDAAGNYSVLLGSTTATGLPGDLFSQQEQRWLGVQIQGQAEQPRVLMVSVPYAFKAHEAETLGGKPPSAYMSVPQPETGVIGMGAVQVANGEQPPQVGGGGTTNYIPVWTSSSNLGNSAIYQSGNSVGIGTTSPVSPLTVFGSGRGDAVILGNSTGVGGHGVEGVSDSTVGIGVYGADTSQSGGVGVQGNADGTSGTGVYGKARATSGVTTGISGYVDSASGTAGVLNNAAGGNILIGQNNGATKFTVDGNGDVTISGNFTGSGSGITGLTFSQLTGQLGSSQFSGTYSGAVSLSNSGNSFTGSGVGLTGIPFANLSGTLASAQLSGTYSSALTLSNTSNVLYGNGANLTGVNPAPGSPNYIQNGTSGQGSANFNISGNGTLGGSVSANVVNTATTYEVDTHPVLSIGSVADNNLFAGRFAGTNNVVGKGVDNVFSGYAAGYNNTTGSQNTFVGLEAGENNTAGSENTFVGFNAGLNTNTTSGPNDFFGYQAGFSNILGIDNDFFGYQAGYNNIGDGYPFFMGSFNAFFGYQAGYNNTTGVDNDFFGYQAGYNNTNGIWNAFFGYQGGYNNTNGSQNDFVGYQAGYNNTTGDEGTFVGYQAGYNNTGNGGFGPQGNYNSFFGYQAGYLNTTGYSNVFLGVGAGYNNTTGSNDVYIANSGPPAGTESDTIRIGFPGVQTAVFVAGVVDTVLPVDIPVSVNGYGQLGITASSLRFKEQVRDMGDSTDALMKLRPVTFLYKPEYARGDRTLQYGLIAEEVAKVYPELVAYDKDGQPYTVRYQHLAPMLLNELQKQYRQAEEQSRVIAEQQAQIRDQQQQIEGLKQQLQVQNASLQERLSRLEKLADSQAQTVALK